MHRLVFACLSLLIALSSTSAHAEVSASENDQKSVYEINEAVDGSIIGFSLLASGLAMWRADAWIKKSCPCPQIPLNFLDRNSVGNSNPTLDVISDVTLGLLILGPPVLDAVDLGFNRTLKEDLFVFAESLSVNNLFTNIAKYSVQKPLPRTVAGDQALQNSPGGYRSFYSGHTSTAFASLMTAAMTINLRHHEGAWPLWVVGGVGTSVAIERVAAGRHFPTDVLVGMVAGSAVGLLVPYWHQRDHERRLWVTAAPVEDGGAMYAEYHF